MKKFLLAAGLVLCTSSIAMAGYTNYFDQYGTKQNSYNTSGNTTYEYNSYGQKTGTYQRSGNTTYSYDEYGAKTGSYHTNGSTTTQYNQYGQKVKPMAIQRLLMTNTEQKQEVIRKTVTVRPHNIINTDKKSEHLSNERG